MVAVGLLMAAVAVTFAVLMPLVPFVLVALVLIALMRHSQAANAIPN